jgi:hypothetical protein
MEFNNLTQEFKSQLESQRGNNLNCKHIYYSLNHFLLIFS